MREPTLRDVVYALPKTTKWIVLYFKGGRITAYEQSIANINMLNKIFILQHIQTDVSGSVHYEILAINKEI